MHLMDTCPMQLTGGEEKKKNWCMADENKACRVNVLLQRENRKVCSKLYPAFGSYVLLNSPLFRYALTQEAQDKSKENE
jgi:hypothetical protein